MVAKFQNAARFAFYGMVLFLIGALVIADITRGGTGMVLMAFIILYLVYRGYRDRQLRVAAEQRHAQEMAELHLRTIEALAVAIDAKDSTTHGHLQRVLLYTDAIGRKMRLPEPERKALRAAALLHDIGKLAVPEHIISKPGRLTAEEFERMKIHTVVGAEILERVKFPYPVVPIVRSHHERWNGTGYPDGLAGDQIPLGARILAVVDSFDAMASDRQYRRAMAPDEALAAVKAGSGELYDPKVVELLEKVYPTIREILRRCPPVAVKLSTDLRIERGSPRAGLSVENAGETSSALYSISQARQELQILYELTQALGSTLSVDETLQLLGQQLRKLIHFDTIAIYVLQNGKLVPRLVEGLNAPLLARLQIPMGQGLSGWVAGNGKPSLNGNPAVEPGYSQNPREFSKLRSALSVPLDSSKGTMGALTLYSSRPNAFTVDHLRILKTIGMKAGPSIHNALLHEAMGRTVDTDGLTGLPNARALALRLEEEAARAMRQRVPYSVFVIDMNGLKRINDQLGHLMGNKVLKVVANALRTCLREYDFLARMGGDEFVVLLPGMGPEDAATKRVELAMAVEKMAKGFPDIEVSISMGSASFPADGQNVEQLVALADRRMYWHKRQHYSSRPSAATAGATTAQLEPAR